MTTSSSGSPLDAQNATRGILVVDLGAQYAQLIARRIREAHVWSTIAPPELALERARSMNLGGIILSGKFSVRDLPWAR